MKNFHKSRRAAGRNDYLNAEVKRIERDEDDFLRFSWEALGLPPNKYPGDKPYWTFMPEYGPDNEYHGDF